MFVCIHACVYAYVRMLVTPAPSGVAPSFWAGVPLFCIRSLLLTPVTASCKGSHPILATGLLMQPFFSDGESELEEDEDDIKKDA